MQVQFGQPSAHRVLGGAHDLAHLLGVRVAHRVGQRDFIDARARHGGGHVGHPVNGHGAFQRAAKRRGHRRVDPHGTRLRAHPIHDGRHHLHLRIRALAHVGAAVRVADRNGKRHDVRAGFISGDGAFQVACQRADGQPVDS
ncbi:hypothetical protein D3C87_1513070 [compost metagenome]